MFFNKDISFVKHDIQKYIGSRVKLKSNKGRQKCVINEGVITDVYPSIFTVQLFQGTEACRKISFSYTEVLTNSVEITLI